MLETVVDITGVLIILVLVVLLFREKQTSPHSEYLRLLDEMPPYDPSALEREALKEKIDETRENLKVLETLMQSGKKRERDLNRLRHKMKAIELRLLQYELLKRKLDNV